MILNWILVIIWMGVIYFWSSIPSLNSGWGIWDFILRKIAHMTEFAILTALLIRAVRPTWGGLSIKRMAWLAALGALLYAISDEIHQTMVVGREGTIKDVAIDGIGILTCAYLWARSGGHFRLKKL